MTLAEMAILLIEYDKTNTMLVIVGDKTKVVRNETIVGTSPLTNDDMSNLMFHGFLIRDSGWVSGAGFECMNGGYSVSKAGRSMAEFIRSW